MRSARPCSEKIALTLMPGALVKLVERRGVQAGLAVGVDVHHPLGEAGAAAASIAPHCDGGK
jgi:hypothetical protein